MATMSKQEHLLVVDDDHEIRSLLGRFLREHQYQVSLAADGEAMFEQLDQESIDLVILDLMLPGEDGFSLCRKLRAQSSLPIIMLTASGDDVDRILGLELGADDYMSKPFNPRELVARIKAILRRSQQHTTTDPNKKTHYTFNQWHLDRHTRQLTSPKGLAISLSSGEFDLLLCLLQHPQRILSRDQLLTLTKRREAAPFDRSIDIQISRLRKKIEVDPKNPQLIQTVRGGGYQLSCNVEGSTQVTQESSHPHAPV
jgi:two-component system OmpR family response regulator